MKPSISRVSRTGSMPAASISAQQRETVSSVVQGAGTTSTRGIT